MQVKSLEKPNIKFNIKMNCDEPIDDKLLKYESIKYCFSTASTTIIAGGCGSGKTSYVMGLIKNIFKKCFHDIFLIIPENSLNSIGDKNNVFNQIEPEYVYNEYNKDILEEIYEKVSENSLDGYNTLLIIDDFGNLLKNKQEALILQQMFLKNRHLKLSIFVLCQNYYQIPKIIREISNNAVLFNTNKSMNEKFFNEMFPYKKHHFENMMKLMKNTHDNILCSLKHKKIYYNWDELIFED